jgi:hypothetical protein
MARNATATFDGLVVGYGTRTVSNEVGSVFSGANGESVYTVEIDLASLPAHGDQVAASYPNASGQQAMIPQGSVILRATATTLVLAAGSSADIDIGTWGPSVVDDQNGLEDALLVATTIEVGNVQVLSGAMIADAADSGPAVAGNISNSDVFVVASYATAYTAGRLRIDVTFRAPSGSSGRTIAVA